MHASQIIAATASISIPVTSKANVLSGSSPCVAARFIASVRAGPRCQGGRSSGWGRSAPEPVPSECLYRARAPRFWWSQKTIHSSYQSREECERELTIHDLLRPNTPLRQPGVSDAPDVAPAANSPTEVLSVLSGAHLSLALFGEPRGRFRSSCSSASAIRSSSGSWRTSRDRGRTSPACYWWRNRRRYLTGYNWPRKY